MAVTNYYTVNGRIRGESTSGTRTNYLHDALGSVTATTNESGSVVNTYRYKPYGARLSKTGAGADPKFQWVGQHGYRSSPGVPDYVRSRHYQNGQAAWTTADPLWPPKPAYSYANASPVFLTDPVGLAACQDKSYENDCSKLTKLWGPLTSDCIAAYCAGKGGVAIATVLKGAAKALANRGITLLKWLGSNVKKKVTDKGDPFKAMTDCCKEFHKPEEHLSSLNKEIVKFCRSWNKNKPLGSLCILEVLRSEIDLGHVGACDYCCNRELGFPDYNSEVKRCTDFCAWYFKDYASSDPK